MSFIDLMSVVEKKIDFTKNLLNILTAESNNRKTPGIMFNQKLLRSVRLLKTSR